MNDERRLTQLKKEFDSLKLELGIAVNERQKLKKSLRDTYKIKNYSQIDELLEKLNAELKDLEKQRDSKFEYIESKLSEYRR